VEEVCDAALDRDASERAAFIASACGDDLALRQEVEALLTHAQSAEGFSPPQSAHRGTLSRRRDLLVGRRSA
jgi:hypothetical protein